jgi:uncharacterized protein (DUF1499 family)
MSNKASADRRYPNALSEVRRAAQEALTSLGWSWKASSEGGFDAVWTSRVFRFKDDVSVRLHCASGTLVRVQSVSRQGKFDFGQNRRHVRDFFEDLERHLVGRS